MTVEVAAATYSREELGFPVAVEDVINRGTEALVLLRPRDRALASFVMLLVRERDGS
jgi:hypothetical protein